MRGRGGGAWRDKNDTCLSKEEAQSLTEKKHIHPELNKKKKRKKKDFKEQKSE